MSTTTTATHSYGEFFRTRTIGRAPSPPTWACYEQIPFDDDYSDSMSDDNHSCSEDEEDYARAAMRGRDLESDEDDDGESSVRRDRKLESVPRADGDMEIDEADEAIPEDKIAQYRKAVKGKQRAVDPEEESPKRRQDQHRKKPRQPQYTLRPILTIQRSQGFVWNQVRPHHTHSTYRVASLLTTRLTPGPLCPSIYQR